MIDRLLEWVRIDAELDGERLDRRFRALRLGLMIAVAVEQWNLLPAWTGRGDEGLHLGLAVVATIVAPFGYSRRFGRPACALTAALVLGDLLLAFPRHANHQYLIFLCTAILAGASDRIDEERRLALGGLRWLLVIAVFWAGVQKVLYGYHFGGEIIAMLIAEEPRFAVLFSALISDAEIARLTAIVPDAGAGPYRVRSLLFLLAVNASLLGELVLPPALLARRTRAPALALLLLLFVAIEAGAREVFFGVIVVQLTLLFAERDWLPRLLPLTLGLYALLLIASFGWLGDGFFT